MTILVHYTEGNSNSSSSSSSSNGSSSSTYVSLYFEQSQLSLHNGSDSRGILRGPVRVSSSEDSEGISHLDQVLAQIGFRLFCSANLLSCF